MGQVESNEVSMPTPREPAVAEENVPLPVDDEAAALVIKTGRACGKSETTVATGVMLRGERKPTAAAAMLAALAASGGFFPRVAVSRDNSPNAGVYVPMSPRGGVGRNDPCPCGSGRKFKHCCRGKA